MKDLGVEIGQRVGRLVIVAFLRSGPGYRASVRCDCGEVFTRRVCELRTAVAMGYESACPSCVQAMLLVTNRTHGDHGSKEHTAWCNARTRCTNRNVPEFVHYGGRGIRMCERWESYEFFLSDMGRCPSPTHSLDRIDVNGHYEPANCRWATKEQQAQNTRTNVRIELNGETMTLSEWSRRTGISRNRIASRLRRGWTAEQTLTVPA